jgi:2,4-dienoyl-CoA reductase-like NADH-dependent reductase (Old Yellow Enzyme family)
VNPFTPGRLGPKTLRNRVIKAATFEGRTRRGVVSDALIDFHAEVAAGGAGMTTVAYCAVSPAGRVNPHCLVLDDETVPRLRLLTDRVHAQGALASAQLGHAGLVADQLANRTRSVAPSTRLSPPAKGIVRGATLAELAEVRGQFATAARHAVDAGFGCLEVHLGHNYLLSSFLSPNLNKRKDQYGGTPANRAAFPRDVVKAVRDAVGSEVAVIAKLNMDDGVKAGLHPDQSVGVAHQLQEDGCLDALELTGGSSLLNGMYFFRGDVPMREFVRSQPKALAPAVALVLRRILPAYPFEEGFFLPMARQFLAALDLPLVLLGGINRRETMEAALDEGFAFVAMARALLREPDLLLRMQADEAQAGICIHCNKCAPTIYERGGTRCVVRDPLPLAPAQRGPQQAEDRA